MTARMTPTLDIGKFYHQGNVRQRNEDALNICQRDNRPGEYLFIIADGVGGEYHGDAASQMAVERIEQSYYSMVEQAPDTNIEEILHSILQTVNIDIFNYAEQLGVATRMGTTAVIAVIRGMTLTVGWVGDSRAYVISRSRKIARQITRDHSQVEDQVRSGVLSPEEAAAHPERNILSRSLGGDPYVEPETITGNLEAGDLVLLCSDGLSRYLDAQMIAHDTLKQETSQQAANIMGKRALKAGGKDNISAIVIHVGARSEAETVLNDVLSEAETAPPAKSMSAPSRRNNQNLLLIGSVVVVFVLVAIGVIGMTLLKSQDVATMIAVAAATPTSIQTQPTQTPLIVSDSSSSGLPTATNTATCTPSATATTTPITPTVTLDPNVVIQRTQDALNIAQTQVSGTTTQIVLTNQAATQAILTQTQAVIAQTEIAGNIWPGGTIRYINYSGVQLTVNVLESSPNDISIPLNQQVEVQKHPSQNISFWPTDDSEPTHYYVQNLATSESGWVETRYLSEYPVSTETEEPESANETESITSTPNVNWGIGTKLTIKKKEVWLRLTPDGNAIEGYDVLNQGTSVTSTGDYQYDGRQGWWRVTADVDNAPKTGWIEQGSLEATG